jgi:hypothetical protein
MTRPAPATAEAPPPSESADPSGRLLQALLSSAGLRVRGEVVSAPTAADPKLRSPQGRAASRTR